MRPAWQVATKGRHKGEGSKEEPCARACATARWQPSLHCCASGLASSLAPGAGRPTTGRMRDVLAASCIELDLVFSAALRGSGGAPPAPWSLVLVAVCALLIRAAREAISAHLIRRGRGASPTRGPAAATGTALGSARAATDSAAPRAAILLRTLYGFFSRRSPRSGVARRGARPRGPEQSAGALSCCVTSDLLISLFVAIVTESIRLTQHIDTQRRQSPVHGRWIPKLAFQKHACNKKLCPSNPATLRVVAVYAKADYSHQSSLTPDATGEPSGWSEASRMYLPGWNQPSVKARSKKAPDRPPLRGCWCMWRPHILFPVGCLDAC